MTFANLSEHSTFVSIFGFGEKRTQRDLVENHSHQSHIERKNQKKKTKRSIEIVQSECEWCLVNGLTNDNPFCRITLDVWVESQQKEKVEADAFHLIENVFLHQGNSSISKAVRMSDELSWCVVRVLSVEFLMFSVDTQHNEMLGTQTTIKRLRIDQ